MLKISIKYSINEASIEFFNRWYSSLVESISLYDGYLKITCLVSKDKNEVEIKLYFSDQSKLSIWATSQQHVELAEKIKPHLTAPLISKKEEFLNSDSELKIVLITGGSRGIGRALALRLAERKDTIVIAVARNLEALESLRACQPSSIKIIQADLSEESQRDNIVQVVKQLGCNLTHVVHNAAIIDPIKPISDLSLEEYRYQQRVNVEAPLFLTNKLLPIMNPHARFLFLTSGVGSAPWSGIGSYSISKATLSAICRSFQIEFVGKNTYFACLRPGAVDTTMLDALRNSSPEVLPEITLLKKMEKEGLIISANESAAFIEWVLYETPNNQYQSDWGISDQEYQIYKKYR